jgi:hypothetical protein
MSNERLRRRVALEAARLIFTREETQFARAKSRAVRQLTAADVPADDLPTDREIRRHLRNFDLALPDEQERLLTGADVHLAPGGFVTAAENTVDRFRTYELLLLPLESVLQPLEIHPEGDALYHSLQVFVLGQERLPYDEEFLLAALLHDVGKAIDRHNHVAAGLEALTGAISERTYWLIENHSNAMAFGEGTLGIRHRRRLEAAESFDELMTLADCDRRGRAVGMAVPEVDEALAYLRKLAAEYGET